RTGRIQYKVSKGTSLDTRKAYIYKGPSAPERKWGFCTCRAEPRREELPHKSTAYGTDIL
ncbi:hypothetical protein L9F63_009423, partial [Diploptera punctata]